MKPHERLHLIDKLLREKKFPNLQSINKILEEVGDRLLSSRQLLRDVENLKELLHQRYPNENKEELLKFNRVKKGYQYKEGYTAFSDFSRQEMKSLADLLDELKNHKHLFLGKNNLAIYEKIKALAIEQEFAKGNEHISWSPVSLIKEGERNGQEYFDEMIQYIRDKQCIDIKYKRFGTDSKLHQCLPILIKEYNSGWYTGWYLLALPISKDKNFYLANTEDLIVYALDRIEKIEPSKLNPKIKFDKKFKPDEYFKHVFGIIRNNLGPNKSTKVHKVVMETTNENWIYDYILKYPIHHTQKIIKNNPKSKYLKFSIEIEIDKELENYLFNHSAEIRVLLPKILRSSIINRLQSAMDKY